MQKLTDKEKWELLNQAPASDKKALGLGYLIEIVSQLSSDSAAEFLRSYDAKVREQILAELPKQKAEGIREIFSYPSGSSGSVMAKEYMSLPAHVTVGEAIDRLQQMPPGHKGKISYIYAVDNEDKLSGVLHIKDLITYSKESVIREIMKSPVDSVKASSPQNQAADMIQQNRYMAVPVIDASGKLAGVVSAGNVIQMIREQADKDITHMVGTDSAEIKSRSVFQILRIRMPWLSVNILSGLLCAFITGLFESSLEALAVLFLFIPVVLGLSESTGIQGATIVVRNLSVSRISFKELGGLFLKEILVGILIGSICGIAVGIAAYFWKQDYMLGVALAVSLNVAIMVSALTGLLLPVVFKAVRIDPAIASGPLVLAICDLQTLLVYFNLASRILNA